MSFFIVVPQLRNVNESEFVKKEKEKKTKGIIKWYY